MWEGAGLHTTFTAMQIRSSTVSQDADTYLDDIFYLDNLKSSIECFK